ncbi:hypothetical protein E2I00_004284, partial [Balaenoptera physalus]
IGRGGEQISRIQAESGCKIQIASDGEKWKGRIVTEHCRSVLQSGHESRQAKRLLGQIVDRCRNGPGFHNDIDGNSTIQEILIPASKVGLVIGKGGETIKQLQERTGVKMVMIQDGPLPTGADKPLRITGDPFKVQQAREMVLEIIREKDQADFRGVRGDFSSRMGGGSIEVSVPRFAVGIVIGRNGEMIKKIQNDAGVRIQFKPDDGISPERAAQVMGPPERCQHAAHVINELILTAQERDGFGGLAVARGRGRGRGDWSVGTPGGIQEITYTVPADKCGLVIGKGGENIKSINQQSGAHVELQRNPPPNTDPNLRIFTIRGVPQQIELARHLIDEKVGGTSLGAPGAFGQSPFSQPPAAPHQNTFPPRSSGCFPNIAAKVNGNPHSAPVRPAEPAAEQPARLQQGLGRLLQKTESRCQRRSSGQLPAGLHNGLGGVLQTAGRILRANIRASSGPQPGKRTNYCRRSHFRRPDASQVPVDSVSVTTGPGPKASRSPHCQNGPLRLGLVGTGVRVHPLWKEVPRGLLYKRGFVWARSHDEARKDGVCPRACVRVCQLLSPPCRQSPRPQAGP